MCVLERERERKRERLRKGNKEKIENEAGGLGETCTSQGATEPRRESVVHLQLIHAPLPLCAAGAARHAGRGAVCVCV